MPTRKGAKPKKNRPPTVHVVAENISPLLESDAADENSMKKAFVHVCNLNDKTLKASREESSFHGDISKILEFTKHAAAHAPTEANILQLQLRLKKHQASAWIQKTGQGKDKSVMAVVLGDKLHYPKCVVSLEILLLCFQEKLICENVHDIWARLEREDEVIKRSGDRVVKSARRMLTRMTWGLPRRQLQTFFNYLQTWQDTEEKLERMRHLADGDNEGTRTTKVLSLLWKLAKDTPDATFRDKARSAHVQILKLFCERVKDWKVALQQLGECINVLCRGDKWFLLALKHFMDILNHIPYKHLPLEQKYLEKATDSLLDYMKCYSYAHKLECTRTGTGCHTMVASTYCYDGLYNHQEQVDTWLNVIIQFIKRHDNTKTQHQTLLKVWKHLVECPIFPSDRGKGLTWFGKLVKDECLKPQPAKTLFLEKVVKLDPWTHTEDYYRSQCFQPFYDYVSSEVPHLKEWQEVINQLWHIIYTGKEYIKSKAISYMQSICRSQPPSQGKSKEIRDFATKNTKSRKRTKQSSDRVEEQSGHKSQVFVTWTPGRNEGQSEVQESSHPARRQLSFEDSADQQPEAREAECAEEDMLQKTASLSVCCEEGRQPDFLSDSLEERDREDLLMKTSVLVHWAEYEEDELPLREEMESEGIINMTLTVASQDNRLALLGEPKKERVIRESFHFLHTDFAMELGKNCEDYIAVYTGDKFVRLSGHGTFHPRLARHPMMKAVKALSGMTLKTFGYNNLKKVITGKNVIYIALLYMDNTPAYYVGKAANGIKERWCTAVGSHCKVVNIIMRCFEHSPGLFEPVVHHQLCDLAIAGAVLKHVAKKSPNGVALFAVDFCKRGVVKCCNPDHKSKECKKTPKSIDHYEQHHINAFKELFPDSDTEPKMKCLNAQSSCSCHSCSDGKLPGCSTEVALSLFLHDLHML